MQALPLILSAVGTAAQSVDKQHAGREQERIAREAIRRNQMASEEGSARVAREIQNVGADTADAERANAQRDFMDSIKRNLSGAVSDREMGGVSSRFAADSASAQKAAETENSGTANVMARIDAPAFQRIREARRYGDVATDLSLLQGRNAGQDFLTKLRLSLATPNPGAQGAGEFLTAFGQAAATRAKKPATARTSSFAQLPDQTPYYGAVS